MRNSYFLLLFLIISSSLSARLYTNFEIAHFYSVDTNSHKLKFVNDFNQTATAKGFIDSNFLKASNPLRLESNYLHLLEYVESQGATQKNRNLIRYLQLYTPQAMKMHDEGSLQEPIFNIKARAQGVENYWSFLEVKHSITDTLNTDFLLALEQIKLIHAEQHEAKSSAIKKSIESIDENTRQKLSDFFMNNSTKISGIEKFVTDFAIKTKDALLLGYLVTNLSANHSDYLMRKIADNFEPDFVLEKLIQQVKSKNSSRFSMSLLKPYVNSDSKVQHLLIQSLTDEKLASVAAFSLSGLTNQQALKTLQKNYENTQSELEKNNIMLALELNANESAQEIMRQLKAEK